MPSEIQNDPLPLTGADCPGHIICVTSLNMRKWMKDRLQRRKKKAPEAGGEPAPPPLQPAYFDAEQAPSAKPASSHVESRESDARHDEHKEVEVPADSEQEFEAPAARGGSRR